MVPDEARLGLGLEFANRPEAGLSEIRHLQTHTKHGSTSVLKGSSFPEYCWMSSLRLDLLHPKNLF